MTQTEPQPSPSPGAAIPLHPADILMNLIVALLAPMFLGAAVMLGVGASIDFIAGVQKRSPEWMSKNIQRPCST